MNPLHGGSGTVAQPSYPPPPPLLAPFPPQLRSPRRRTRAVTLALAGLAVVLAAAALILALFRPTPATPNETALSPVSATPTFTVEQMAAAKAKACEAAKMVNDRLLVETNWPRPTGPDDSLGWAHRASALNTYLSAVVWLPTQLDPATPQNIRLSVTAFSGATGVAFATGLEPGNLEQLARDQAVMSEKWDDVERGCRG